MVKKCLFNSGLKVFFIISAIVFVVSCSGKNSEEWPKMQADNLWQDLEERVSENDVTSEQEVANEDTSLLELPYQENTISISEVRETLRDVEFLIPQREKGIAAALSLFENAAEEDKASFWRGVEIEKSRINDIASRLRSIEYQLTKSDQFLVEKKMAAKLLEQVERIMPAVPTD